MDISLSSLCRVCAHNHSADRMVDIFATYNIFGTVDELIVELTGLTVEKDDGLPSFCCIQCQSDLRNSVDIRRRCIESEAAIKSMLEGNSLQPSSPAYRPGQTSAPENRFHTSDSLTLKFVYSGINACGRPRTQKSSQSGECDQDASDKDIEDAVYLELEDSVESSHSEHAPSDGNGTESADRDRDSMEIDNGNNISTQVLDAVELDRTEIRILQHYQCIECNESFPDLKSLCDHSEKSHHQRFDFSEEDSAEAQSNSCIAEFLDNRLADDTNDSVGISETSDSVSDQPLRCCGCSLYFATEDELMQHSQSIHAPNAPLPDKCKPAQCNICYSWYKTKRNVRDHQFYMRNRRFKCTVCGMQFGRASGLLRHKNSHDKALIFACKHNCGKLFATVYRRMVHEKGENCRNGKMGEAGTLDRNERNHTCCGCALTLGTEEELLDHARSVHAPSAPAEDENKPAQCNVCYRWYKTKRDVRIHQLGMRNRLFQCATCGKKFRRPSHLAEHENVHTKALIFACKHCEERFPNKTARQRHVQRAHGAPREAQTNTAEPHHVCTECGKSFHSADYLKQHMILHADETPHKCHCGAQFKLKIYLARHMKIHSGQYTCKYCPAAYPCASLLKGHENRHLDHKEFSCEVCGKQFYAKADVRKHRQKVHEKRRRRTKGSTS